MNESGIFLKAVKIADAVFHTFSKACLLIAGVLLVLVSIMVSAGVFNRALTDFVWLFVEEWCGLALIPMSYLVFGYTLRKGRHLKMDLLVRRLSRKGQAVFSIFAAGFSLVCLAFMIQSAANWLIYALERNVVSSGPMQTPLWIFSFCIFLSLILFAADMFLFLINRIFSLKYQQPQLHFVDRHYDETPLHPAHEKGGV